MKRNIGARESIIEVFYLDSFIILNLTHLLFWIWPNLISLTRKRLWFCTRIIFSRCFHLQCSKPVGFNVQHLNSPKIGDNVAHKGVAHWMQPVYFNSMIKTVVWHPTVWSAIRLMLVTDVGDERSWWQLWDVGDVFGRLSRQHRLSNIHSRHQLKIINITVTVIS